jgi:bifunctional N-acetylglucosamine-1-phosphate-uridyltransferase/glucosamine-1-phosphate-acetyltransferase GlmU-like protein
MKATNRIAVIVANGPDLELKSTQELVKKIDTVVKALPDFEEICVITSERIVDHCLLEEFAFSREVNLVVARRTRGALATLCVGIDSISESSELFVIPINCLINTNAFENFAAFVSKIGGKAGVLTIKSKDPIYSYARITKSGKLIEIIEKEVVGDVALSGVFYFRNSLELLKCAAWAFKYNINTNGRFYIAPALNYFIAIGESIMVSSLSSEEFSRV